MTRRSILLPALLLSLSCAGSRSDEPGGSTRDAGATETDGGSLDTDGGSTPDGGQANNGGPPSEFLPTPTGTCPTFATGQVTFTVGDSSRNALVWVSSAAETKDGPLVFWWHGNGGDPSEATGALGSALSAILAEGGVVIALYHDPAANSGQLPWYLSLGGSNLNDVKFADEALACAIQKVGVDTRRIHSVGFSAGAMHNTQFAALRSGYLASIVNYSGAQLSTPTEQDPTNKYPAMLFYGGQSDQVSIVNFATYTKNYHDALQGAGHFTFMCNHNQGHTVPGDGPAAAWRFLQDHPYGVNPEPYADALPSSLPSYCAL